MSRLLTAPLRQVSTPAHEGPGHRQIDRVALASFLRHRREALAPERVGLPSVGRRRTPGLRRDEVATLACMSTSYYERLEQARGPWPSPSLLATIARALDLTADERNHLYLLAGQIPPAPDQRSPDADPELISIMGALAPTTIALLSDSLGTVLHQNRLSETVFGNIVDRTGRTNNWFWQWFTDLDWRNSLTPFDDQETTARSYVADLRATVVARNLDETALSLVRDLRTESTTFADLWDQHEVLLLRSRPKTLLHPKGKLDLHCAVVQSPQTGHRLWTFQPLPGTDTGAQLVRLSQPE